MSNSIIYTCKKKFLKKLIKLYVSPVFIMQLIVSGNASDFIPEVAGLNPSGKIHIFTEDLFGLLRSSRRVTRVYII
jgi:hypothetical protein